MTTDKRLPCKWLDNATQGGIGFWAPLVECQHDDYFDMPSCENCLGYEALQVAVCEKHGKYFVIDGCDVCYEDKSLQERGRKTLDDYFVR